MKINVDLTLLEKMLKELPVLGERLVEYVDTAIEVGAIEGRNVAAENAPYLTGALKDGIKVQKVERHSYEVTATMPYSVIHEYGGTITLDQVVYIPAVGFRYISTVTIAASGYMAKGEKKGAEKAENLVAKAIDTVLKDWN